MTLTELLDYRLVLLKTACASKDELIKQLAEQVYSTGLKLPLAQDDLLKTIFLREKIGGTLLPSGLSVPHARLRNFEGFILALGTPAAPLPGEGFQARLMALMITSQSGGPHYLEVLAALTKISKNGDYFSRLCEANNVEAFIGILKEHDYELS